MSEGRKGVKRMDPGGAEQEDKRQGQKLMQNVPPEYEEELESRYCMDDQTLELIGQKIL